MTHRACSDCQQPTYYFAINVATKKAYCWPCWVNRDKEEEE